MNLIVKFANLAGKSYSKSSNTIRFLSSGFSCLGSGTSSEFSKKIAIYVRFVSHLLSHTFNKLIYG